MGMVFVWCCYHNMDIFILFVLLTSNGENVSLSRTPRPMYLLLTLKTIASWVMTLKDDILYSAIIFIRQLRCWFKCNTAVGSSTWWFDVWQPWIRQKFWHEDETWWWYWYRWEILGRRFSHSRLPWMWWSAEAWGSKYSILILDTQIPFGE